MQFLQLSVAAIILLESDTTHFFAHCKNAWRLSYIFYSKWGLFSFFKDMLSNFNGS